jgi:GNAT superfamily N-acetyltransferase
MAAVTIRPAQDKDVASIVALLADDMLGAGRENLEADLAPYRAALAEIEADRNNEMYVMEVAGRIAGCFQLTVIPGLSSGGARRGLIESVRIASGLRGTGHGTTMIRWAIQVCRGHGCKTVQLTTNKQRVNARRFYERLGFVASHEGMKLDL